jgi:hypothetical protein
MGQEENKDDQSEKEDLYEDTEMDESESPRGVLPKKGFFDNLAKKADEIKRQGMELGKIAAREAGELGEKIDDVVDDGLDAAKKLKPQSSESKNEIIDLLERLASLKEQGIITEKEFTAKKKDLLNKI